MHVPGVETKNIPESARTWWSCGRMVQPILEGAFTDPEPHAFVSGNGGESLVHAKGAIDEGSQACIVGDEQHCSSSVRVGP